MQKVNLNKSKAQFSRLVLLASLENSGRVGFLKTKGEIRVPENFNDLHSEKIEDLFNGKE
ncbi:MAG TPA: hypothetical protein VJS14_04525 [Enterobacteriaceae bacterium]|nr:hypothetical protein [Enterobacteriaceae bacterium]